MKRDAEAEWVEAMSIAVAMCRAASTPEGYEGDVLREAATDRLEHFVNPHAIAVCAAQIAAILTFAVEPVEWDVVNDRLGEWMAGRIRLAHEWHAAVTPARRRRRLRWWPRDADDIRRVIDGIE